jgi:L-2-hydroxyglutarate oxidase LhgO
VHAGFYYSTDSLKARLCRQGNVEMTDYIQTKGLPLRKCGKLVVARSEADWAGLDTLFERGRANGVPLEEVSEARAKQVEPLVLTKGRALWSPSTACSDPLAVLQAQVEDAKRDDIDFAFNCRVTDLYDQSKTGGNSNAGVGGVAVELSSSTPTGSASRRRVSGGHFINCAGLYADTLAHKLGFGLDYSLVPFKGLYLYCDIPLSTLVYPVPDLGRPFLGVHFTVTFDGKSKIGPTAIPAFFRENYGDPGESFFKGFSASEAAEILATEGRMFLSSADFRTLAFEEIKKYSKEYMAKGASELVSSAGDMSRFKAYGRPGIRAQLVRREALRPPSPSSGAGAGAGAAKGNTGGGKAGLVMDYVIESGATSTHVLNAVSPAWTCSAPFARLVVDRAMGATAAEAEADVA